MKTSRIVGLFGTCLLTATVACKDNTTPQDDGSTSAEASQSEETTTSDEATDSGTQGDSSVDQTGNETADSNSDSTATTTSTTQSSTGDSTDQTGDSTDTTSTGSDETTSDTEIPEGDPARGNIAIGRIVINQGAASPLYEDGSIIAGDERYVTLVGGRPGLFQAFWEIPGDWKARTIKATLTLKQADGSQEVLETTAQVSGKSEEGALDTAFSWVLSAEEITGDTEFQVELWENDDSNSDIPESDSPPKVPADGLANMGADDSPVKIQQVIVPMVYSASGCSTDMRDLLSDPAFVEDLRVQMFVRNPVQAVEIEIRDEPMNFNGTTWDQILGNLEDMRISDSAPPNRYYYAPLDSCSTNLQGFGGYSWIPSGPTKNQASQRCSSGRWTSQQLEFSYVTYVHETGHAEGRYHTDCGGPAGPDQNYPHEGAIIGVWGYDVVNNKFQHPVDVHDHMSYCYFPSWISDYGWHLQHAIAKELTSWGDNAPTAEELGPETLKIEVDSEGRPLAWWTTHLGLGSSRSTGTTVAFSGENARTAPIAAEVRPASEGKNQLIYVEVPENLHEMDKATYSFNGKMFEVGLVNLRRIVMQ